MNANTFRNMRDILICYGESVDEDNEPNVLRFSAMVQTMLGHSDNAKIEALCYLFDNLLTSNARLASLLNDATGYNLNEKGSPVVTKEDAFTALQMAITAMAANYQNGAGE